LFEGISVPRFAPNPISAEFPRISPRKSTIEPRQNQAFIFDGVKAKKIGLSVLHSAIFMDVHPEQPRGKEKVRWDLIIRNL
jgi:hypothetical protein